MCHICWGMGKDERSTPLEKTNVQRSTLNVQLPIRGWVLIFIVERWTFKLLIAGFHINEPFFQVFTSAELSDGAIGSNDPVAGNQDWKRVRGKGCSNEAICPGTADGLCNVPVGGCPAVGNVGRFSQHPDLEWREAFQVKSVPWNRAGGGGFSLKIIENASGDPGAFRAGGRRAAVFGKRLFPLSGRGSGKMNSMDEKRRGPVDDYQIADRGVLNRVVMAGCIPRPGGVPGAGGIKRSIRFLQQ